MDSVRGYTTCILPIGKWVTNIYLYILPQISQLHFKNHPHPLYPLYRHRNNRYNVKTSYRKVSPLPRATADNLLCRRYFASHVYSADPRVTSTLIHKFIRVPLFVNAFNTSFLFLYFISNPHTISTSFSLAPAVRRHPRKRLADTLVKALVELKLWQQPKRREIKCQN